MTWPGPGYQFLLYFWKIAKGDPNESACSFFFLAKTDVVWSCHTCDSLWEKREGKARVGGSSPTAHGPRASEPNGLRRPQWETEWAV